MTVSDWIATRSPAPPPALSSRIIQSLGDNARVDAALADRACLDAAVDLLEGLLAREPLGRDAATELLTADALVTYAFEAAAARQGELEERAADAMLRLATLAASGERPVP
jgi:hypothetical protein